MRARGKASKKIYITVRCIDDRDREGVTPDIRAGRSGENWRRGDDNVSGRCETDQVFETLGRSFRVIEGDHHRLVGRWSTAVHGAEWHVVQLLPAHNWAAAPVGCAEILTLQVRSEDTQSRIRRKQACC